MKKKNALAGLITFVVALALLQNSTVDRNNIDSNLQQLGAGAIVVACTAESNNITWGTAGGILASTGAGICQASVPVSWSPVGWYGLGIGLVL